MVFCFFVVGKKAECFLVFELLCSFSVQGFWRFFLLLFQLRKLMQQSMRSISFFLSFVLVVLLGEEVVELFRIVKSF